MVVLKSEVLLLLFCLVFVSKSERMKLEAKKLLNGKVIASGYSVVAKSVRQCMGYCNNRMETCDGIVYNENIGKCRLIDKCAPAFQMDNSTGIAYYSKRPLIKSRGYVHDPKTDTCIGLLPSPVNYPSAEMACSMENGNLVVVSEKRVNKIVQNLLSNSSSDWGWISYENIAHENRMKPHGISGNDVLSVEVFSPEVTHWRNDSNRICWGVNKFGQWGQFSCKNKTMSALCQVYTFKL